MTTAWSAMEKEVLLGMFREDVITQPQFNGDEFRAAPHHFNIAENFRLATEPQPRPARRTNEKEEQMAKKMTATEPAKKTGGKKQGKFVYCKELIGSGKHTFKQIVAMVSAKFPEWPSKLVECGIFSSRYQMRKAGIPGDWLPEAGEATTATAAAEKPAKAKRGAKKAAVAAPETAVEKAEAAAPEEKPLALSLISIIAEQ